MTTSNVSKIRGRFAPSPTGYVHIGGLRTALFNYLFVKKQGGDVLLRIEDTDRKRYVEGAVEGLIKTLLETGIAHDEGPFVSKEIKDERQEVISSRNYPGIFEVGDFGPYIQSERLDLYREHVEKLIKSGHAYYCFCTPERLESVRKEQSANKQMPKYDRHCLSLSPEEISEHKRKHIEEGAPQVIRFKLPDNETIDIEDMVRGKVSFNTASMSDAVLLKSDGFPTYHLAMAVDDHSMQISHVLRTEEWLPSLPLHALLYRAFEWEAPQFAHLPFIVNADRTKLSKRQGDVAVEDYLKKGYLPEALINFVALLGWNPGDGSTQEIFSLDELIEAFDIARVHKAGAVFDLKKLDWINAQYIKKLSVEELYEKSLPFLEGKDFYVNASSDCKAESFVKKALTIDRERLTKLSEAGEGVRFAFVDTESLDYDAELLRWKKNTDEQTKEALMQAREVLESIENGESLWTQEHLSEKLLERAGEKRGDLLWPLRVALTGLKQSPSPFEAAWILGKDESLRRLEHALVKIG